MWLEQEERERLEGATVNSYLTGPCGHPGLTGNEVEQGAWKVLNHGMTQSEFHFSQITPATEGGQNGQADQAVDGCDDPGRDGGVWTRGS